MGRKTYESIGRLLPDRKNIIITRDKNYTVPGATIVHSLEESLEQCRNEDEAFVIGGAEILNLALPYVHKMYLTHVDVEVPADAFFPEVNWNEWKVTYEKPHPKDEKHLYNFTYKIYEKI
jgi:dihydrofolate reductase (trimethoprim resistance protein)